MGRFFYDYFSGKSGVEISDRLAINEDGDMIIRISDNIAENMDTGDSFITSWSSDDDDEW